MANESTKWLYEQLTSQGYNVGKDLQEFEGLMQSNEESRNWAYDTATKSGLNVGKDIDEFTSLVAPTKQPQITPVSPTAEGEPASQAQALAQWAREGVSAARAGHNPETASPSLPGAESIEQSAGGMEKREEGDSPTGEEKPTERDKIAFSYGLHRMIQDFDAQSKARLEQVNRIVGRHTDAGRQRQKAGEMKARMAGTPATVGAGLPQDGSPIAYGVTYENGEAKTQWLLPDGSLTTNIAEAYAAEDKARAERLQGQFIQRMKSNGLDPAKQEDVERQATLDLQKPAYDAVAELWDEAERLHKEDRNKNAEKEWGDYAMMGGGREMRMVTAGSNRHKDTVSHMTRFDIEKMMNKAWDKAGSKISARVFDNLRRSNPEADESELKAQADEIARRLTDNAVYEYAVKQNTPKSTLEFFGRTVADMNLINSIGRGLARSEAGTSGDLAAYEQAMAEYGKNHKVAQVAGTVVGMAVDPTTWLSGGVGSISSKGALNLGSRFMMKEASREAAKRAFGSTLTGRIIAGTAGAAGNLATYEGMKEGERQWMYGGHINPETGENEGYSPIEILKSSGHGAVMGSIIGPLSPVIGNVADKTVTLTNSTGGKLLVRGGEVAVSTLAEGTVFSIPQWIEGEEDAFDVWTDNMAMMLGFKAQHGIKSVPQVIQSLRPIKPTEGRPLTQAERNHNRMDFMERLRNSLDGNKADLSFTEEERDELRRNGYGELGDLFTHDSKKSNHAVKREKGDNATAIDFQTVDSETIHTSPDFEGYSEMEALMSDPKVSEATKAKAYYMLTGRMLPMSTIVGYNESTTKDENGKETTYVESVNADGGVVTSRKFTNRKDAEREMDAIARQAELNSIDIGERYKETEADDMVLNAAINEVSPGADLNTVKRIYQEVKSGGKVSESQRELAEFIDEAIERNKDIANDSRPEAIRNRIQEETGVDVDKALKKSRKERTEEESKALETYAKELFPERPEQETSATPEQETAQSIYEEAKLLPGRYFEEQAQQPQDPNNPLPPAGGEAKADIDAITLRMREAYDLVDDVFEDEADIYRSQLEDDPFTLANDPTLTPAQRDVVLNYINSKAALEGVMDGANEVAQNKMDIARQEIDHRTNKDSGMVQPAVMKLDDRTVYIVKGNVVMFPDGKGVDLEKSDEFLIIADPADPTKEYKPASKHDILKIDEPIDPQEQLAEVQRTIEAEQATIFSGFEEGNIEGENIPENGNNGIENIPPTSQDAQQEGIGRVPENADLGTRNVPNVPENVPNDTQNVPEPIESVPSWQSTLDLFEGNKEEAISIVNAQIEQAQKAIADLQKNEPKYKQPKLRGTPQQMKESMRSAQAEHKALHDAWQAEVDTQQTILDQWNAVKTEADNITLAEQAALKAEQEEKNRIAHELAVAQFEEEQRIKAEKEAAQAEVGTHAVNPKIKEKWDNANKIVGNPDAITLPDGSTLRGHYVLAEAGAATPSHDVNNAYAPTEGFPIDANGQSVNDRDYQRDSDAQRIVEDIAGAYDNRALQTPVIVSKDGVVLSGNNRTMSGELAAKQGTDKAYNDYLKEFGAKYGFAPEVVEVFNNPRLVFVPDENMPYDATTFSRFNAQEMKSQSKPEAAVKLGKVVPDNVFSNIVDDISRYDRLSEFYADEKAVAQALGHLMQAGVINDKQMPELRTGTALSAAGKELIENTLIGKVFQSNPDAVRQIISIPTLRQGIVMGLSEIASNRRLAKQGYDLSDELAKAVDLVQRAKTAMPDIYTDGMPVSPFGRQAGLFDDEFGESMVKDATTLLLADILNSGRPSDLRKVLATYNAEASQSAAGQIDMFTGGIATKEDILTQVNEHFRNATPKEQQALVDAAIAERKRRADEAAADRAEQSGGGNEEDQQTENAVQRSAEPEQSTPIKEENDLTPEEEALEARLNVTDNEWTEGEGDNPTYKRDLILDGKHTVVQVDEPDEKGNYNGSYFEYDGKKFGSIPEVAEYIDNKPATVGERIATAEAEVNTQPTEAQKEAGNYKKGHVQIGTFDVTIENPKGSVRSGKDRDGKEWSVTMQHTYGYIRGTQGVDGDHIDVYASSDIDGWNGRKVFVVDQYNPDGTFDEHKVMLGFNDKEEAYDAYLSNYEKGWENGRRIDISTTNIEDFEKWIDSSKRKTKPFAEYKTIKREEEIGDFGPIFTQFKGKPAEAIKKLIEVQGGEAVGALHHKDVGDIDLVWGEEGTGHSDGFGLAKLVKYHPEVVEHLQEILDDMEVVTRSENRINLESDTHKAAVRLTWNNEKKKWLLTAFEKKETPESIDKTTDTDENPLDLRGDTALSQNSDVSESKDKEISEERQIEERKVSATITPTTYTNKKGKTSDISLVKFSRDLTDEEKAAARRLVSEPLSAGKKTPKGWYDRNEGGYMMRSEEAAKELVNLIDNPDGADNYDKIADNQPLSREDLKRAIEPKKEPETKKPANEISIEEVINGPEPQATIIEDIVETTPQGKSLNITEDMKKDEDILRDLLGIGEDEVDGNVHYRLDELTPEQRRKVYAAGVNYSMGYIEQGLVRFEDFALAMSNRLGEKIKPWLKSFYEGVKRMPSYEDIDFTPTDEVDKFDIDSIGKPGDIFQRAEAKVEERKVEKATKEAEKELIEERNKQRKQEDEQTTTNTKALEAEAKSIGKEADTLAKTSTDEREINAGINKIDDALNKINKQLGILGYYDSVEPIAEIEKRVSTDGVKLAQQLALDLGINFEDMPEGKDVIHTNFNEKRGIMDINLPIKKGYEPLRIEIAFKNDGRGFNVSSVSTRLKRGDNLSYVIGYDNHEWLDNPTYKEVMESIKESIDKYLPKAETTKDRKKAYRPAIVETNAEKDKSATGAQTPILKQYEEMKKVHPEAILLFRVGDFYEVFKQDAKDASDILGITLTKRSTGDGSVEMAGFPHHALDSYLPKLVRAGRRVAVCEQLEEPKLTKKLAKRPQSAEAPQPKEHVSTEEATKQALEALEKYDRKKEKKEVKPEATIGSLFNFEEDNSKENESETGNIGSQRMADEKPTDTVGVHASGTDGGIPTGATATDSGSRGTSGHGAGGRAEADGRVLSNAPERGVQSSNGHSGRDKRGTSGRNDNTGMDGGRTSDESTRPTGEIDGRGESISNGQSAAGVSKGSKPTPVKTPKEPKFKNNFRYGEEGNEADRYTPSQRLEANVSAIETLADILLSGKPATAEQKEILSRFRGWGQVDLENNYSVDMMERNGNKTLRRLATAIKKLDPQGEKKLFEAIRRAALSAYYTPTPIARAMNTFLSLAGYRGGNFLDPSMGNGVFEGTLPKDIQERSAITGVELDWLSGQLSRQLYPDANIIIGGFEKSGLTPGSFDVVTSNVPFGQFAVNDPTWAKDSSPIKRSAQNRIHNYFAVKMLESAKPGGLVAMMTSNSVMDTPSNQNIRAHIAEQGEIIGAIRMPDNTFQGTGAVADIIFIRKYKDAADRQETLNNPKYQELERAFVSGIHETKAPSKVNGTPQKVKYNSYYSQFPKNMIGEVKAGSQYSQEGFGLTSKLTTEEIAKDVEKAVKRIVGDRKGMLYDTTKSVREAYQAVREEYRGDGDWVSNGNLVIQDGKVGVLNSKSNEYGEVSRTFESLPTTKLKPRIESMIEVRTAMKKLIAAQIDGDTEKSIDKLRGELKQAYDNFVEKFGRLQDKDNAFILDDIDGYTIQALENWKGGKFQGLSDIFTKNTIKPALRLEEAKTPQRAIATSLAEYGYLRPDFMEQALGKDWEEKCKDIIFKVPNREDAYVTRDEYLSGDVVSKLQEARNAAKENPQFERNVKALEEVQPTRIPFDNIAIHLGARWIPEDILNDFIKDILGLHATARGRFYDPEQGRMVEKFKSGIKYLPDIDSFEIFIEKKELGGQASDWETPKKSVSEILRAALEDKNVTIKYKDSDGVEHIDEEQTELANQKIADLRDKFEEWLPGDDERVNRLEQTYNDRFNRIVIRKFDGSHLNVPGLMGKELRPHQKDAVWMLINNQGGIVDHIVGAGKTLVMQAAIMEMRRMGIAKKPMIVALKSTVSQIAREFKEAFPAARVLAPNDKDFQKENRKKFIANISLNDYDCVILSHEQYSMIPHTEEAERAVIDEQLWQLDNMIEYLYGQDDQSQLTKRQIKGLEKRRENLIAKLEKRLNRDVDKEFCFENMGVDYLFVDESHQFKALPYVTSYQNVAGLGSADGSDRAVALLTGIRHLQRMHQGDKGTVFLSGTTITNSLVEIYNLLNYLRPRELEKLGLPTFDAWASTFAIHSSELEAGTTGEFKMKDRFRNFDNVPELSQLYTEIADVRNDQNLKLPKPNMETHTVIVKPSEIMTEINREIINMIQNKDGSYFGIHPKDENKAPWGLHAATISAKAAVSPKLIFPDVDDDGGKVQAVSENVAKIYKETADHKGVQLIFCELGVPGKDKKYDVYTDFIRRFTEDYGIPRNEIAYIQEANTEEKRKELFQKVRDGKVRILIGGTKNMGTGVNVQDRITDMHMVTVPWTPSALEQCIGRGVRQGNKLAEQLGNKVRVHYYATEGSLDLYKYQLLDAKGKMFTQFKTGTINGERSFDEGADTEGGMDPAEMVARLSGNPVIFEKAKQEKKVKKLRALRNGFERDYQRKKTKHEELTRSKGNYERLIRLNDKDRAEVEREGFKPDNKGVYPTKVTVSENGSYYGSKTFDKPKEAGEYIHELLKAGKKVTLSGFGKKAEIERVNEENGGLFESHYEARIGTGSYDILYKTKVSDDDVNAGLTLRTLLKKIVDNGEVYRRELSNAETQLAGMNLGDGVFPKKQELEEAEAKLKELTAEYNKLGKKESNGDGNKYRSADVINASTSSANSKSKEVRISELSQKLNTPVRIINDVNAIGGRPLSARERRAKGWYDTDTNEVVIVEPNNVNVADVENTFVHEVVGHKGLRAMVGEEGMDEFVDEIYNHASDKIKASIDQTTQRMVNAETDRLAQKEIDGMEEVPTGFFRDAYREKHRPEAERKREKFRREATEEFMSDMAGRIGDEGFEKMSREEQTLWGRIKAKVQQFLDKFLKRLNIPKGIRLTDKDIAYILYKSWKNMRDIFDRAEDVNMRRKTGYDSDAAKRFRDPDMGLEETITKMKAEAMQANADNLQAKRDAMRAIGGNLNNLRSAMARQREYDITTVKSITDLAKVLMDNNLLDDLSKTETKRILGAVNNVVGRQDVSKYVQKIMDIMVDNQLRIGTKTFSDLVTIKGRRVDARGIEVQGILDPDGQRMAQVVKKSISLPKDDIENRIAEALNRMGSSDQATADEAAIEYSGLQVALRYAEEIKGSKSEEKDLRESLKQAKEDKDAGQMTEAAYKQYVQATEDAIRQNKIERAEAYQSLIEAMSDVLGESVERAKAWKAAEIERVKAIQHNANSDMEGRPTDEHHKNDRVQKLTNNSGVRFLLAPLGTFDQMLRMFGKKNAKGEGYLWNRYMRGWVDATEKEYTGYRDSLKILDSKVSEVFGKKMSWGELFTIDRKLPKGSVAFWDGGEMKEHELTQGNLLYIYMADKMADGRMKLRRMGITEEDIEDIKNVLDPRFIELADWMQDEFLTDKRNEYNEVHKRMFGASMAAIENYFPLKILANARLENIDVADDTTDPALPATTTGSVIKRRRNNLALDVAGANAFSVILDHLQQMERWAAFAEFNRDLNTLLSYKRFRNQVMNMSSAYGAGKTLWNNFRNVCSMAAGAYRPPIAPLDKAAVNIAKGVTAAKVSFRIFTALKQFLSMPAYVSDSNPMYLAKNIVNPAEAWKWSMENLPIFEKRWKSRMAGDPRLMKSDMDWKAWRSNIVQIASRIGMSPNAFVDALTVSIGAHAMYETKLAKYLRQGYDQSEAETRAKQDATILFNQTQQSSEGAFLSTMQVDRSWLSVLFTVFRNSSMSYTRQEYDAIRNLKKISIEKGYKELSTEFMAKQILRYQKPEEEGNWSDEDWTRARKAAKEEYRSTILRDIVRLAIFGIALQMAWNLGPYIPYLLLGEDEDEKSKMWDDVMNHSFFGSIEGFTGGDVMSAAGQMVMNGDKNYSYLTKDMPLVADVVNILKKMPKDQASAMNDVVNLLVQSGIGVNPQSLTDAVVAVIDACGEDAQSQRECALLIARVINCPQSQIDKIYFDELGLTGTEASKMTPAELAERYADYKLMREAPLTGWTRSQETEDSIRDAKKKKVLKVAKEKLTERMATEETKRLLAEYDEVSKKETELNKLKKTDREGYKNGRKELRENSDLRVHNRVKRYKRDMKELTEQYLRSRTPEERDSLVERMFMVRERMLEDVVQ